MAGSDDDVPTLIQHDSAVLVPADPELAPRSRVPLTIICGFLGAGKSTLLKYILTKQHGYRIAVIMNEFGDTADIEAKAINISSPDDPAAEQSEEFLELPNGCLCCSIKDTGAAAIEKLMQRKGAFDYILLETTGLADPGPIAAIFWHNEEFAAGLGNDIILDGVVCVVDAVFGEQQMTEDHATDPMNVGESLRQIAGSDIIILNKTDLATPEALAHTETLINQVNPAAPIYRTVKGEIDLKNIIGISAYSKPPPSTDSVATVPHVHTSDCDHSHDHDHKAQTNHYEFRGISSLQVECSPLSSEAFDRFDQWIRTVLWENHLPEDSTPNARDLLVLRCKGVFSLTSGERYVLQGVRNLYEIDEAKGTDDSLGVPDEGKVVLIGKGLDDTVRGSLESVLKS
ncbi:CobW domain-containing protein [Macrolepiota fuliginosa MF-IS2]|uniref:CobW domain-containing protein n=1 Tax=Macrolepiota fuliginosa MF-IS2 TaxID=1400762 RepID=A0A9P6CB96_9AGAR|nr:CobW domain-containing protein [Macrolepiota fuliginosa MF-IS2]